MLLNLQDILQNRVFDKMIIYMVNHISLDDRKNELESRLEALILDKTIDKYEMEYNEDGLVYISVYQGDYELESAISLKIIL